MTDNFLKTMPGLQSRRHLLRQSAAAALAGFAMPAIATRALGQSKFDWKKFSGEKIDVMLTKNPRADLMQAWEKQFTEETGIIVSSEQIPEQQQRQKALIEFTSGRPTFDVVTLALHVQKRLAAKGKWLDDLRPLLADGSMTSPAFEFSPFLYLSVPYA